MRKEMFLSSADYSNLSDPRRIMAFRWVMIGNKKYLIVRVDKPVEVFFRGEKLGKDNTLYLFNRYPDDAENFRNLSGFPFNVSVFVRLKSQFVYEGVVRDFISIAWASLYDSLDKAQKHLIQ